MAERDDGGPAFPGAVPEYIDHPVHGYITRASIGMEAEAGMSLRDWFAGQALVAYLGGASANAASTEAAINVADRDGVSIHQFFAEGAFKFADAMLAARKK